MSLSTQCLFCARYRGLGECAAYPTGIPGEILTGEVDHEEPYAGDHGLRFVRATSTPADEKYAYPQD